MTVEPLDERAEAYIARLLDEAPPLTAEQGALVVGVLIRHEQTDAVPGASDVA